MKAAAQQYINLNIVPIPLSKKGDGKGTNLPEWQKKFFSADDFNDNNNIGINLKLSELIDADLDSTNAVYFGSRFLTPTRTMGIKNIISHYFYKGDIKYIGRTYPDGKTIAELGNAGQTVAPPSIAESKLFNNERVERVWINNKDFILDPGDWNWNPLKEIKSMDDWYEFETITSEQVIKEIEKSTDGKY